MLGTLLADGLGMVEYADRDVRPGSSYSYRLAFASGAHAGDVTLTVPLAPRLALAGARPNPAVGGPQVMFTLPDAGAARLELFDLRGRRLERSDVGGREPGVQVVRLGERNLAPGLYWIELTHGTRTLRSRVVVMR